MFLAAICRCNVLAIGCLLAALSTACGRSKKRSDDGSGASTGTDTEGESSATGTGTGDGGSAGAVGGSGDLTAEFFEACPDTTLLRCGNRLVASFGAGGASQTSSCEFQLDATLFSSEPLVVVDCEAVPRFEATLNGAAGEGAGANWAYELGILTFQGEWCERLQEGFQRIDVFQTFAGPC